MFGSLWVCEILLGLWLISGVNRVPAVLTGIAVYAGLAVVSGRMAVLGVRDCGCLGTVPANPWVMFGLDILSLLGLGVALRCSADRVAVRHGLRRLAATSAVFVFLIAAVWAVAVARYGSFPTALRTWQGHSLEVSQAEGAGPAGDDGTSRVTLRVRNHGGAPLRIVGTDVCCGARAEARFPLGLDAGAEENIIIILDCARRPSLAATLWVEADGRLKKQRVVVSCRGRD